MEYVRRFFFVLLGTIIGNFIFKYFENRKR